VATILMGIILELGHTYINIIPEQSGDTMAKCNKIIFKMMVMVCTYEGSNADCKEKSALDTHCSPV